MRAALRVQQAHQEVKERELKEKFKRMTLYKDTLEDEDLGDDEPQVEPARIPLTLKITEETTFGLKSLVDPGASHNFISFEAWQTLPKGSMVPTNATVRTINGTRTKPIGHLTLDIVITQNVLWVRFYVLPYPCNLQPRTIVIPLLEKVKVKLSYYKLHHRQKPLNR